MKSRFLFQKQSTPQRTNQEVFSLFESFPKQQKQIYQNQLYYNSHNQKTINKRIRNRNQRPKSSIYSSYTEIKLRSKRKAEKCIVEERDSIELLSIEKEPLISSSSFFLISVFSFFLFSSSSLFSSLSLFSSFSLFFSFSLYYLYLLFFNKKNFFIK